MDLEDFMEGLATCLLRSQIFVSAWPRLGFVYGFDSRPQEDVLLRLSFGLNCPSWSWMMFG